MAASAFHVDTVHLAQFTDGDARDRAEFVRVLGGSLKDTGFVKVAGHGVTAADVTGAYEAARDFFALPEAVKRGYIVPDGGGARGFTAFGSEHAKDNPVGDLKEFWHVGQELPAGHPLEAIYGANLWPDAQVPGFRAHTLALYRALEACAGTLLEAIALYLELPRRALADMIVEGNSVLRIIHYPALKDRYLEGGVRASAHEDINLITLLPAALGSGLQLLDRDGSWHAVDGLEGEIVADAGDMLSRHVNQRIPSTTHRVVNPDSPDAVRYSMPFFCHPRPEVLLDCPESLLAPGERKLFEPITAHAFLLQRLREIGLLPVKALENAMPLTPAACRLLLPAVLAAAPLCAQFTPSQKLPQERLDALQRMSMPGTEHSRLARREGRYTTVTRHFAAAGAAGAELTGKAELKVILGGRFLVEDYHADKVGGAEGTRIFAYDGTLKQYQAAWANAGATGLVHLQGESRDGGATVVLTGTLHDADGEPLSLRLLIREVDPDRFLVVLGGDEKGQGPRQEILYTRVSPAGK